MDSERHPRPSSRDDFKIAIICTLPLETDAVIESLDEVWHDAHYGQAPGDETFYNFGRSGGHTVVIATLPGIGKTYKSTMCSAIKRSFISIELALFVGICGAIPFKHGHTGTEIILGDILMSETLLEFDFGRQLEYSDGSGFRRQYDTIFEVSRPSGMAINLSQALNGPLTPFNLRQGLGQNLRALQEHPTIKLRYPGTSKDNLFEPSYTHRHNAGCADCGANAICIDAQRASCHELGCDEARLVPRSRLSSNGAWPGPNIHFGAIATSYIPIRDAKQRDAIAQAHTVIAFDGGEAVDGAMEFSGLVIKGVCDYADSHKNKEWQSYAAATAASAAKELLTWVHHDESRAMSDSEQPPSDTLSSPSPLDFQWAPIADEPGIPELTGQSELAIRTQSHNPENLPEAQFHQSALTLEIPPDSG